VFFFYLGLEASSFGSGFFSRLISADLICRPLARSLPRFAFPRRTLGSKHPCDHAFRTRFATPIAAKRGHAAQDGVLKVLVGLCPERDTDSYSVGGRPSGESLKHLPARSSAESQNSLLSRASISGVDFRRGDWGFVVGQNAMRTRRGLFSGITVGVLPRRGCEESGD